MSLPRPLAWALLLAALFLSGLLRQWHHKGPALALLTVLLILIVALFYRSERALAAGAVVPKGRVPLRLLLPFLLLVVGEKWVALVLVEPSLLWIPSLIDDRYVADATYRLMTGLALAAVALTFLFMFRWLWPQLKKILSLRALGDALLVLGISSILLFGILFVFVRYFQDDLPARLVTRTPSLWLTVAMAAQVVRAAAEEFYFRGMLQEGLTALMRRLGIATSRYAKLAAVLLVSMLFALEHAHMEDDLQLIAGQLIFVFGLSVLFGLTLVLSRSLYLTIGFHLAVNFYLQRFGLLFVDPRDASDIFDPRVYILMHTLLLFVGIFAITGPRRRARRRALEKAAAANPPAAPGGGA